MSDQYRVGAAGPQTATSLYNMLVFIVQQELAKARTSIPAKIIKAPYDAEGNPITPGAPGAIGFVDVLPLVNQTDGQGNSTPHGVVYGLSYHRYQSGYGAIIADPKVDDIGHLICADRDTSAVRSTNAQANPGSGRKFSLADAVFFGCPQAGAAAQYLSFLDAGLKVADDNGNVMTWGTSGISITAPNGMIVNGATITGAGEVINKAGIVLGTHLHTEVTAGGDDTGPPAT